MDPAGAHKSVKDNRSLRKGRNNLFERSSTPWPDHEWELPVPKPVPQQVRQKFRDKLLLEKQADRRTLAVSIVLVITLLAVLYFYGGQLLELIF